VNIPVGIKRQYFGWNAPFEINARGHSFIIGATGTGKSTLLESLIVQQIRLGNGVLVIDPHGQLVESVAQLIPRHRTNDVIWFDPTSEKVPGLNPLRGKNPDLRVDQFIDILAHFYGSGSWLARSDYISRNLARAVTQIVPNPTAIHITRAFIDDDYRHALAAKATDTFIQSFFRQYDEKWDKRQREEAAAAPTNKLDILNKPVLRDIIGQPGGLDLGSIMDSRKILLCRFAKGLLGPEVTAVLGAIMTSMVLHAALERLRSSDRPLFSVYIDEFHNLTRGMAHEHLLSETRKYSIALTLADQTIDQLPEGSESSIFGNVSNLIVGRVGARDAERLAKELASPSPFTPTPTSLQTLKKPDGSGAGYWYGKATYDSILFEAFPPMTKRGDEAWKATVIRRSSSNYGEDRKAVENRLTRFLSGLS
jgi:hypothetical protein